MINRFLSKIVLHFVFITFILLSSSVYAEGEKSFTKDEINPLKEVETIRLVVKASSWRGEPYDIQSYIRKKMELVGFVIVPEGVSNFDATMFVDYEENKSHGYNPVWARIGNPPSDYGTCIHCSIRVEHKTMGTVFKMQTRGCTPSVATSNLFGDAFSEFEKYNDSGIFFLGIYVASAIGKTEMPPNMIDFIDYTDRNISILKEVEKPLLQYFITTLIAAMKDKDLSVRWRAAYALGQIKAIRAVEALINALKDENSGVRWNAAIALRSIQLAKTTPEEEYFGEDPVKWQEWWTKNKEKYTDMPAPDR